MATNRNAGARTASLRTALGLSQLDLATRSGCDPSRLDRFERGELSPSLAPLARIARVLGVRLGTLMDDESSPGPVVVRRNAPGGNERFQSVSSDGGPPPMEYLSIAAGKSGRHMDPFLVVVNTAGNPPHSTHEGEEFLYVMEGAVTLEYGKEEYALETGDSIYYDSIVEHRLVARGALPARLLSVLYAPV